MGSAAFLLKRKRTTERGWEDKQILRWTSLCIRWKEPSKQLGFAFWQMLQPTPHQHLNAVFYLLQIFSNQCQIFTAGASDRCSLVGYLSRDISHCKVVPLRCQYTLVRLSKHRELQYSQLMSTCRQIYNSESRKVSRSFTLPKFYLHNLGVLCNQCLR